MKLSSRKILTLAALFAAGGYSSASLLTETSPSGGPVPPGVTSVGGVVFDAVGVNGARLTAQLAASSLFSGFYDDGTPVGYQGNPGTIGIQTGVSNTLLMGLGGGFTSVSVRFTLFDGDNAPGNFDFNNNLLLVNGLNFGNWSTVATNVTTDTGVFVAAGAGFGDEQLATGWFTNTNAVTLSTLYSSMISSTVITYKINDLANPFDNSFDFTRGVNSSLIDVDVPPVVAPAPEPSSMLFGFALTATAMVTRFRRRPLVTIG